MFEKMIYIKSIGYILPVPSLREESARGASASGPLPELEVVENQRYMKQALLWLNVRGGPSRKITAK